MGDSLSFPERRPSTSCTSLDFVSYKDRKPVAAALKGIHRVVDAAAWSRPEAFEERR